jgi:hypothetical protein
MEMSMRGGRFSIRFLILAVALAGIGSAALSSGSEVWAATVQTLVIFCLSIATVSAILVPGNARAFLMGCAFFGWQCFLLDCYISATAGSLSFSHVSVPPWYWLAERLAALAHPYATSNVPSAVNTTRGDVAMYVESSGNYLLDVGGKTSRSRHIAVYLFNLAYASLGGLIAFVIAKRAGTGGRANGASSRAAFYESADVKPPD